MSPLTELAAEPTDDELDQLLAEKSLWHFLRQSWHVVEPATPFVDGFHIGALCEHFQAVTEGQIQNLLVMLPPGSTKSITMCVVWPAWEWIRAPHIRWLFGSYSLKLASRDSEKCRNLIRSRWYRSRWAERFYLTTDAVTELKNNKTGSRECVSPDSSTTGEHADRLGLDDPHNVKEVESQTVRESTIRWHDQAWYNRVNDYQKSTRVVMAQRTHEEDLIGHLEKHGGYEILRLPEEYDSKISRVWPNAKIQDQRSKEGQLLRPDRFGPAEVQDAKKRLGSRGYAAQHQQAPKAKEGNLIKYHWFRRYSDSGDAYRLDDRQEIHLHRDCWTFCIIDPAKSKKKTADRCAIGTFSVTPNGRIIIRDVVAERLGHENIVPRLNEVCAIYRPQWVGIEADGFQVFVVTEARSTVLVNGRWLKKHQAIPTVHELETEGKGKVVRAQPAIIRFENGEIYLPATDKFPWVEPFENELTSVTGFDDVHDDQFDIMAWAVLALDHLGFGGNVGEPLVLGTRPQRY
jgi:phage terminase large subunit-like protein